MTLLTKSTMTYTPVCPPVGVAGSPPNGYGNWGGKLVSALDGANPVAVCDVQQTQAVTTTNEGGSSVVTDTESTTYDNYGRVTQTTSASNSGTPATVVHKTSYVWNDGLSVPLPQTNYNDQSLLWGGQYLLDTPALQVSEDASGNRFSCAYSSYDGQAYATGQMNLLYWGHTTAVDRYGDCGVAPNYTPISSKKATTTNAFDNLGNHTTNKDAEANNGNTSHTTNFPTCGVATSCTQYD